MNKPNLFREQIITSAIDNDAYKLHMMQVVYEKYPTLQVEYDFKCRSNEDLTMLLPAIREQISLLENVYFTEDQLQYLGRIPFLKKSFLNTLRDFRFNASFVSYNIIDNELKITIKGSWLHTILYEVPILAIVSEVRNKHKFSDIPSEQFRKVLMEKTNYLKDQIAQRGLEKHYKFADFGTRRRYSYHTQRQVAEHLAHAFPENFIGTSNYHLARELNLKPIGTMAHEYLCAHQAIVNPRDSQKVALEVWNEVYRGHLGIALTDTITTDAFLEIFDLSLSKLYDGVRQDSGDPYIWGDKFEKHYRGFNIDPMTKNHVFSDGLDFESSLDICENFKDRINTSFGIGTFLSNDMGDFISEQYGVYKPLSIVIKLMDVDGHPVAKISDEPNKSMCRVPEYLSYLKYVHNIKA
jgi:nicotinate phosphoribosyltransferase